MCSWREKAFFLRIEVWRWAAHREAGESKGQARNAASAFEATSTYRRKCANNMRGLRRRAPKVGPIVRLCERVAIKR